VLLTAYTKLYPNKGATTPSYKAQPNTNPTSDSFSIKQLKELRISLMNKTWKPIPVKQIWIPKPGKKTMRPIGLNDFNDKIVSETIRMVLHAIYEPEFETHNVNFGFRPGYSTHSCFKNLQTKIQGLPNAIEGDIKGAYPSLNHKILMKLLKKTN